MAPYPIWNIISILISIDIWAFLIDKGPTLLWYKLLFIHIFSKTCQDNDTVRSATSNCHSNYSSWPHFYPILTLTSPNYDFSDWMVKYPIFYEMYTTIYRIYTFIWKYMILRDFGFSYKIYFQFNDRIFWAKWSYSFKN